MTEQWSFDWRVRPRNCGFTSFSLKDLFENLDEGQKTKERLNIYNSEVSGTWGIQYVASQRMKEKSVPM